MKLFLTSSGICTPRLRARFHHLVGKSPETTSALFIPTAADPEPDKGFVGRARSEIGELSHTIHEGDLTKLSPSQCRDLILTHDILYINGGNTFYLLYWALKTELFSSLSEFFAQGGVYVGVSAGSILVCPTIEVARWKGLDDPNVVELTSLAAADLVPFHIFPHYHERWSTLVENKRKTLKGELKIVRDCEAIVVDGTLLEKVVR